MDCLLKALEIRKNIHSSDHLEVAETLNNIGYLNEEMEQYF